MKNFKMYLEAVQIMNTDKETKITGYQNKLKDYNDNKSKFDAIISTKKQDQWEVEAAKLINGNDYLATAWKLAKMNSTLKTDTAKLSSPDVSADEKKQIQIDVNKNKQELAKEQQELNTKIQQDLRTLQQL
jgi:hypothetical protein